MKREPNANERDLKRLTENERALHSEAIQISRLHRQNESDIIKVLQKVDANKFYKKLNHRSLFRYVMEEMGFIESVAYMFITVARKARQIHVLDQSMERQVLSVATISRMVSVMTKENANELIRFAKTHTTRELDFEVARRNPKAKPREKSKPISEERVSLEVSFLKENFEQLVRAQGIEAQKTAKHPDYEQTIVAALKCYLDKYDPVRRAERAEARKERRNTIRADEVFRARGSIGCEGGDVDQIILHKHSDGDEASTRSARRESRQTEEKPVYKHCDGKTETENTLFKQSNISKCTKVFTPDNVGPARESTLCNQSIYRPSQENILSKRRNQARNIHVRTPLTADQKHAVHKRDGGRCTFVDERGNRCATERWLDIHHIKEVHLGGANHADNLTTLCSFHHDLVHQLSLPIEGQVSWLRAPQRKYVA